MDVIVEELTQVWPGRGGAGFVALERFTHRFASRRFSCLLGPSGCGKSTLLQVIGGLEPATSGAVRIADPARPGEARRPGADSVMVWQGLNLFPWRSVLDNVAFGLEMQGMAKRERHQRARALVDIGRTWRASRTTCPDSSPAACASAWRSPARSCWSGRSC